MKKILLIEDDEVMRENTAEILKLANYEVSTASNGRDGSFLAKEMRPDLIVSDIMMPGLDGYGVLHVLSKDPQTASIPFIFLTAKAEKSELRRGMELGADDYITKPFEETDLLNAIEIRLKKSHVLKKVFSRNLEGLNQFLDQAAGLRELEDLSKGRPICRYKKNEIIFHEGDSPQFLFFLNKGKVKTYRTNEGGREYITNLYKEGDFLGHVALFKKNTYTDTALVMEESELCKIPQRDFLALVSKNRDVATKFIKMLSNQVEEQEAQLLSLAYDTVKKRTAGALLDLLRRNKGGPSPSRITVTREDLASMAGTVMETAIRCLSEFKEDKIIEVQGREILILNKEGLEAIQ